VVKILHQSKAGIGSMLKIAKAREILPIKAIYSQIPNFKIYLPTAIAHTGPDIFSTACLACPDVNFLKINFNPSKVKIVSAFISFKAAIIACGKLIFNGLI
jgi:hypothetical protein